MNRSLKLTILFCFSALLLCTGDYNPFEDPSNSEIVVTDMTFGSGDTLDVFTTETLTMMLAVPEQTESFGVRAPSNRLFQNDEQKWLSTPSKPLGPGPYHLYFSFYDTGAGAIEIVTRRINGEEVKTEIPYYVRSPLNQPVLAGKFGDPLLLSTDAVGDRDVVYIWDFRMGTVIMSARPETTVVINSAGAQGWGVLRATDGYVFSPGKTFSFTLSDSIAPNIQFSQDNYVLSGDTIRTGESSFFFAVSITDRDQDGVDSASINGESFDIIQNSLYIKIFESLDTLQTAVPLTIYAVDNPESRNDTTIRLWMVYDPQVKKGTGLRLSILVPPSDSAVYSTASKPIMGTVEWYTGDSIDVLLRIKCGAVTDTVYVRGKYSVDWIWNAQFKTGTNMFTVTVYNSNGDSIGYDSRVIIYNPDQKDSVPPVILETTIEGKEAAQLITTQDTALLKIIAFDEGSGIDSLTVNGKFYDRKEEYTWSISLPLLHDPNGNVFLVRVKDKSALVSEKNLIIYRNSPPEVEKAPQPPLPLLAGTTYIDSIVVRDSDNDVVDIRLISGNFDLKVSTSGMISWTPGSTDRGIHEFNLRLRDGYESVIYNFSISVVDSSGLRDSVRFFTEEKDFPAFIPTGSTFSFVLETDPLTGASPFVYGAYIIGKNKPVQVVKDTLVWTPAASDTGISRFKIFVVDTFQTSDTLYPSILVVPPNRPLSLQLLGYHDTTSGGAVDMSDSMKTAQLTFAIVDPDIGSVEQFFVSVKQGGVTTSYPVDTSRNFTVQVSSTLMDFGYDTIVVAVRDMQDHFETLTIPVYYGTAPQEPFLPVPAMGAVVFDSIVRYSWTGGDTDGIVLYQLFTGSCPSPLPAVSGLLEPVFTSVVMAKSGVYCWQVAASDGKTRTDGPVWSFYLRVPGHVQFATLETDFDTEYEALQDSLIVGLSIVDGTGKGTLHYSAQFLSDGKQVPVVNDTVRYLPVESDTGWRKLLVIVTDSVGNSDTLMPAIHITPPLPAVLNLDFTGPFTANGEIDLSGSADPLSLTFTISDPDPDTVIIYYQNTVTMGKTDSGGNIVVTIDPAKTTRIRDTLRMIIKDDPDYTDTTFLIYYGFAPGAPFSPDPQSESYVRDSLIVLQWQCSDPDGNPLTYDLYFGETESPPLLDSGLTQNSYTFYTPQSNGNYYWKIVASDARSSTSGPVWNVNVRSGIAKFVLNTASSGAVTTTDLYNIPVLVRFDLNSFNFPVPSWGQLYPGMSFRRNGHSGTELPYQVDTWNTFTGSAEVWVLLDTLKANDSTQFIHILWGSDIIDASDGTVVFKTDNGFAGVWHLSEQGGYNTSDVYRDATSNGYHGDDNVSSTGKQGVIGSGQTFDGYNDWIRLADSTNFGMSTEYLTGGAWFRVFNDDSDMSLFAISAGGDGKSRLELFMNSLGELGFNVNSNLVYHTGTTDQPYDDGNWHHAVCVIDYEIDSILIYVDGVLQISNYAEISSYDTPALIAAIGSEDDGLNKYFDGSLDEVRVSNTRRSSDWIKFSYQNQKTGSNVVSIDENW